MPELGMFFGIPKKYLSEADYKSLTFESVKDYLIRRELLTPAEKAILEKA